MSRALPSDAATLAQITTTGLVAADQPPSDAPARDDVRPATESSDDPRYESRDMLGRGGMGEVQLCKDLHIGREVARKRILPDLADNAEVRVRFIREAQIQGQLEHPGTVPVYDLVAEPSGAVFFTMKRLRGRTLEDILDGLRQGRDDDRATYSRHRLLQAFAAICLTMDYAHSRGIVHREHGPQNPRREMRNDQLCGTVAESLHGNVDLPPEAELVGDVI